VFVSLASVRFQYSVYVYVTGGIGTDVGPYGPYVTARAGCPSAPTIPIIVITSNIRSSFVVPQLVLDLLIGLRCCLGFIRDLFE